MNIQYHEPSPLPVGVTEFHAWADKVIEAAGAPNNDSVKFALATMILHAGPQDAEKPLSYFILSLKKSMANQVAAGIMQELKAKQQAEEAARIEAEKNKATEATHALSVVSNEPQQ
jgi:hypothetical protein